MISDEHKRTLDELAHTHSASWHFFETDIRNAGLVEKNVEQAISLFGSIDLAVNSAGVVINQSLEETSPEDFKRVIDINLVGSFNFAHAILPKLTSNSQLAFISSIAGLISNYAYSAYGASKFGVVGLATTLRYEYAHKGISISCICPPEVKTPMVEAELKSGNSISLALKKFGGSMAPDDACDQIVAGLDAKKWMIIPSLNAKFLALFTRLSPGLFFRAMTQLIKHVEKKNSNY